MRGLLHLVLGVDDVVGTFLGAGGGTGLIACGGAGVGGRGVTGGGGGGLLRLVDFFAEFHEHLVEIVETFLQGGFVFALGQFFDAVDGVFDFAALGRADLVAVFLKLLLGFEGEGFGLVAEVDEFAAGLVFGGVGLGFFLHAFDFFFGETGVALDFDLVFLAGGLVFGLDVEDAVDVDVEADFDLGHAALGGGDALELELAEGAVVLGEIAFALKDVDFDGGLVVGGGGEGFGLAGGDGGVAGDHDGHDAAEGFDAHGERCDVEDEDVFDFAGGDAALDGGADGDGFVGVDGLVAFFAEDFLDHGLDAGHAGGAADEEDFVDLAGGELGVFEGFEDGLAAAFGEGGGEGFKLAAGDSHLQVLGTAGIGGDEGEVDGGFHRGGEFDLGFFRGFFETLESHGVFAEIDALLFAEFFGDVIDEGLIVVIAAEVGVAVDGEDFEDAVTDVEDGDVEGAAAEIEDEDFAAFFLVHAVGESGGSGFGEDADDVEAGDFAGFLGGEALGVIEVGGDGDDGVGDFFAEVIFGGFLEILEDHGGDFRRGILFAADVDADEFFGSAFDFVGDEFFFAGDFGVAAAHEAFDGEDGVGGVGDLLVFGGEADEAFAFIGEADDGGGEA